MTTSWYKVGDPNHRQRVGKRLLVVLANINPGRDTAIWCGILRDMLARTPRGEIYRAKMWNRSAGSEPVEVIDGACQDLLTELQQHEQLPLFSAGLLQELGGKR